MKTSSLRLSILSLLLAASRPESVAAAPGDIDPGFYPPPFLNGEVSQTLVLPDGKLLVGGWFVNVENIASLDYLMRLDSDGALSFGFSPPANLNGSVYCLALATNGKFYAGGAFTEVEGIAARDRIVRLGDNGALDATFVPPADLNGPVVTMAVQPDGKVVVGGLFTEAGGISNVDRIMRLNTNGSFDPTFIPPANLNSYVAAVAIQPDGKIVIGGSFTDVGGSLARDRLVRLNTDGSLDTTFYPPASLSGPIYDVKLLPSGKMLVGGFFTNVDGISDMDRLIRIHADGSLDTSFAPPQLPGNYVGEIVVQPDGKAVVGGDFINANGKATLDRVVRVKVDGSLDPDFAPPINLNGVVQSLTLQPDGKVLIGGIFTSVVGMPTGYDRLFRAEAYTPPVPNAALKAALARKIAKTKKSIATAKKKGKRAKEQRLTKALHRLELQLQALG